MELPLTGGCVCGAIRYRITKAPLDIYACHCTDCQRATSGACSIGIVVPDEAFEATGKPARSIAGGIADSGRVKYRWVCPDCGVLAVRQSQARHEASRHGAGGSRRDTRRYIMGATHDALLDAQCPAVARPVRHPVPRRSPKSLRRRTAGTRRRRRFVRYACALPISISTLIASFPSVSNRASCALTASCTVRRSGSGRAR